MGRGRTSHVEKNGIHRARMHARRNPGQKDEMREFAVAAAVLVALVGMAGADSWVELTPVGDNEDVGYGACTVGGHGCVFVASGDGSDVVSAYVIDQAEWEDITIDNATEIHEAGAMAYETGAGLRLFVACDGDAAGDESLSVYRFYAATGYDGEWTATAFSLPARPGRGVGMAFVQAAVNEPITSGYLYLLRGGGASSFYRRRVDKTYLLPEIAGPMDGASTQPNSTFLDWNPNKPGAQYIVQIATSATFASPLLTDTTDCGEYLVARATLSAGQNYYWRVRDLCTNYTGSWTAAQAFNTSAASPVGGWCQYPPNNAVTSGDDPVFDWPSVVGAVNYELLLRTVSGDTVADETADVSEYSLSTALSSDYYAWQTRCQYSGGAWSAWSSLHLLQVDGGWTSLAQIPDSVTAGGALTRGKGPSADTCLYALVGHGSTNYWRYDIAGDTWLAAPATPDSQVGGAALAAYPGFNSVHGMFGGSSETLYKYRRSQEDWVLAPGAPVLPGDERPYGSGLAWAVGDTTPAALYLVVAGSDSGNFYRWQPSTEQDGGQARISGDARFVRPVSCVWTRDAVLVRYSLASAARVETTVYAADGAVVAVLSSGTQQPGQHEAKWNLSGGQGRRVAAGVYFVAVNTPGGTYSAKVAVGH
jgi:hypothetical protein